MRSLALSLLIVPTILAPGCKDSGREAGVPVSNSSTSERIAQSANAAAAPAVGTSANGIPARSPLTAHELPTDDASISVGNLESSLLGGRAMLAKHPEAVLAIPGVVETLLAHGALRGKLSEYDEALALAEKAVKLAPQSSGSYFARAAVRSRFHLFELALADLDRAEKLGGGGRELEQRRASIFQAEGKMAEARRVREKWKNALATFDSCFELATVDADEGRFDDAERGFIEAEQHTRDVSPFPLARLWLQEAAMWMAADRPSRSRELLEAALLRVPVDVSIISHLAAADTVTHERDRAITLLRSIVKTSEDPEHAGQLAELLADGGDAAAMAEAKALHDQATARFNELVAAHPEAFADHAARFFLGNLAAPADPARASMLAEKNLALRTTDASYLLAIEADLAAKKTARACELAPLAVAAYPRFARLHVMAAKAFAACGQQPRADAELALSLHPPQ